MKSPIQAAVLVLALTASLGGLAYLAGGAYVPPAERPQIKVPIAESTGEAKPIEKVLVGRGGREKKVEIAKSDRLTGVGLPLIGEKTGAEEGRIRCAKIHYDGDSDRMRLEAPIILLWEVDQATGAVDRSKETRMVSREMFVDRGMTQGELVGDVVVTNQYQRTEPRLETQRLTFLMERRRLETAAPVKMTWGPDLTLTGVGLEGDAKLEMMTIQRQCVARLVQEGDGIAMPLEAAPPGAERVPIVATSTGKMVARQDKEDASLQQVTLHDQVKVVREQTTLTSEVLDLWIVKNNQQTVDAGGQRVELRELVAREQVHIVDPDQGEAFAGFFSWKILPEDRERILLKEQPRVISNNAGDVSLVEVAADERPKTTQERVEITCAGAVDFQRNSPGGKSQAPQLAVFDKAVRVVRTQTTEEGEQPPLKADCEQLTVFLKEVTVPPKEDRPEKKPRKKLSIGRALLERQVWIRDPLFSVRGQRCDWNRGTPEEEKMVVTGAPEMIIRDIEDDRGMEVSSEEEDPDAEPRRVDVQITAKTRLILEGNQNEDGSRLLRFFDDVKVLRFPVDASGKRTSDEPLPSRLASDKLRVELAKMTRESRRAEKRKRTMQMRRMWADGNVALRDAGGRSTSEAMTYDRPKGLLTLTRKVRVEDEDGGKYFGARMVYESEKQLARLFGEEDKYARVETPVDEEIEEGAPPPPPGTKEKIQLVEAPIIEFRRSDGYLHAYVEQPFDNVKGKFWPGKEDGNFVAMDAAEQDDGERQWALTCKDLEAWINKRKRRKRGEKRAPREKGRGSSRLRKMIATNGDSDEAVDLRSVTKPGDKSPPSVATGVKFIHERKGDKARTFLYGDESGRAEVRGGRETVKSRLIVMEHETGLAICPRGGYAMFYEEEAKGEMEPIEITCDGKMTYKKNDYVIFERNVKVYRHADKSTLTCDRLKAWLDPKTRRMKRAIGEGKVRIVKGRDIIDGDRVEWNATERKMVLTATPPKQCRIERGGELFRAPVVVIDQRSGRTTTPKGMEKLR